MLPPSPRRQPSSSSSGKAAVLPMLPFRGRLPQPQILPHVLCDALLAVLGRLSLDFGRSDVLVDRALCTLGAGLFGRADANELGDPGRSSSISCIFPGDARLVLSASARESWIDAWVSASS